MSQVKKHLPSLKLKKQNSKTFFQQLKCIVKQFLFNTYFMLSAKKIAKKIQVSFIESKKKYKDYQIGGTIKSAN
jgi:hypothetical protein